MPLKPDGRLPKFTYKKYNAYRRDNVFDDAIKAYASTWKHVPACYFAKTEMMAAHTSAILEFTTSEGRTYSINLGATSAYELILVGYNDANSRFWALGSEGMPFTISAE